MDHEEITTGNVRMTIWLVGGEGGSKLEGRIVTSPVPGVLATMENGVQRFIPMTAIETLDTYPNPTPQDALDAGADLVAGARPNQD